MVLLGWKCPACGEGNKLLATQCVHCGAALDRDGNEGPSSYATGRGGVTGNQPKRTHGCLWIVGIIVVLAVIGSIVAAGKDGDSGSSSPTTRATTTTSRTIAAIDQVELVPDTLEVTSNSIGYMVLTGKVVNRGRYPLVFVKVRGYALDASGATVNTDYSYIDSDVLAPGATATFTVYVSDPDDEGTRGRVTIEGAKFDK